MDFSKLTLGDKITLGSGIVLLIGLLFLPWHSAGGGTADVGGGFEVDVPTFTATAIESPNSFWGILALLLTAAIVITVILRKLTTTELPELGSVSWADATFFAAIAVGALLILKLVVETDALGWGLWVDLLLSAGLIFGTYTMRTEGDGAPDGAAPPTTF